MKIFVKFLAMIVFIMLFLVSGLYFVLNNLGSILAEEHSGLKWRWVDNGVEIKTGGRVENIQLKTPVNIRRSQGRWEVISSRYILTIDTDPGIRVSWREVSVPSPQSAIDKRPLNNY